MVSLTGHTGFVLIPRVMCMLPMTETTECKNSRPDSLRRSDRAKNTTGSLSGTGGSRPAGSRPVKYYILSGSRWKFTFFLRVILRPGPEQSTRFRAYDDTGGVFQQPAKNPYFIVHYPAKQNSFIIPYAVLKYSTN